MQSGHAMEETGRAVLAALTGNLALAVLKGVSAAATGSAAMLAETFQLFTLGGAFSIREGVHKLLGSGPHVHSMWAFVVLGGAFVFESLSITVAIRALQRARGETSLREHGRRSRDPTLLTVILEDSSAPCCRSWWPPPDSG